MKLQKGKIVTTAENSTRKSSSRRGFLQQQHQDRKPLLHSHDHFDLNEWKKLIAEPAAGHAGRQGKQVAAAVAVGRWMNQLSSIKIRLLLCGCLLHLLLLQRVAIQTKSFWPLQWQASAPRGMLSAAKAGCSDAHMLVSKWQIATAWMMEEEEPVLPSSSWCCSRDACTTLVPVTWWQ